MIDHLNNCIRHLMLSEIDQLTDELQVGFQFSDDGWRNLIFSLTANGQPANVFNVYLLELYENRVLRSNQAARNVADGFVTETPAPRHIDCRYLITAWSPAPTSPVLEPIMDEHALLYQAVEALMRYDPLVPAEVYAPDPVPVETPEAFSDAELPVEIAPPEGFSKHAELWGTMGSDNPWRPSAELVVTLPVVQTGIEAGAMVTTRIIDYRQTGTSASEVRVQIGGRVLDTLAPLPDDSPAPVIAAWVGLEDLGGKLLQSTETGIDGEFSFSGIGRESYRLRARATGHGELSREISREISVPSPTGEYDLRFE